MPAISNDNKFLPKETKPAPMTVTPMKRKRLGEILVEKGIITTFTAERILTLASRSGKRFGTILEEIGLITGEELSGALAIQYGYNTVSNFSKHTFPHNVLQLVSVDTAVEHSIFPLKIQNNTLALAMIDPTNEKIIHNLKENNKMNIVPFIATRKDINAAIAKHYLNLTLPEKNEDTILVVEDDKLILAMITSMLQKEGYKVVSATDGMEAFKVLISNKPRLILTDKEMPKFDGYALLASLKHMPETKTIPVILISSSSDPEEEAIAYQKGFFDYIAKPVKEITLKAKVRRALDLHHLLSTNF
jgi:CheY-like chemotaxis protein